MCFLDPLAPYHGQFNVALTQNLNVSAYYVVKFTISDVVGQGAFFRLGSESGQIYRAMNTGTHNFIIKSNGTTPTVRIGNYSSSSDSFKMCNLSIRELKGNHAIQLVSAARPTYNKDTTKSWLYHDKVDDKMLVVLPAMTATVMTATDDGVIINYPVAIPSGNYTLTNNSTLGRDYGRLIIDKELSASEQAQVTAYFNAKRGV